MLKEFRDKTAVVTGGGSGIGRAMAERFASEGMNVVLADVQRDALDATVEELKSRGSKAVGVFCDVSKGEQVEALAKAALDAFGGVHIVCNNAGVAAAGTVWERTTADWEWVLGVNLWGVIHGIRVFTPIMIKQNEPGHIVNTASMAGLISGPGMAIYSVTKHSVVTLSETLYHELKMKGTKVGCSVLCPGWVQTKIVDSQRNRPEEMKNEGAAGALKPEDQFLEKMVRELVSKGLTPAHVAERVLDAVKEDKFYILTHPQWKNMIELRMQDILEERNPTYKPLA